MGGEAMETDIMGPRSDGICLNLSHLSGALKDMFIAKPMKPC